MAVQIEERRYEFIGTRAMSQNSGGALTVAGAADLRMTTPGLPARPTFIHVGNSQSSPPSCARRFKY